MGYARGYFATQWALAAFVLAGLAIIPSVAGTVAPRGSHWSALALELLAAYAT